MMSGGMPQPLPNLHHLELFYHVVRAGGITAATRSMPYGIQQPAISGQIGMLERELGARLFQRRPFKLTPAGRELFEFAAPFFGGLPAVAARIAGKASKHLRLAAPTILIREHLPAVIARLREREPELELSLVDAVQRRTFQLLENEEVDLAIVELEGKPPPGTRCTVLASLPQVILLPPGLAKPRGGLRKLAESQPLIRPPADTALARLFASGLAREGINWPSRIEVSTIDLVETYVAGGFGCGASVRVPGVRVPDDVTVMHLPKFPKLVIAGLWKGDLHPLARRVVDDLRGYPGSHA